MYFAPVFIKPSKKLISGVVLMLLSMLLVAYAPMASVSMAETAADTAKMQALKQKALDELNRRIANYEKTMKSLNVDVQIKNNSKASPDTKNPSTSSGAVVELPAKLQDQSKQLTQTVLDELKDLKQKVTDASSLTEMQGLGKNIDAQFGVDQLTQVQAMATQAIESMTGVFDNLKSAFNGVQSQVSKIKECAKDTSADTESSTPEGCNGVNGDAASLVNQAQGQLDSLSSIMSTISSVLTSAISLLLTLMTSFMSMAGSLSGGGGGLTGALGGLSSLSSLTGLLGGAGGGGGLGDLSSLTGSLGSITGMLGSFSAITSQLDITQLMSGGGLSSLSSLTGLIGPLTSLLGSVGGGGLPI